YVLVPDGYGLNDAGQLVKLGKPDQSNDKDRLLYSDKIVDSVWPVPQDYFYIELRRNSHDEKHHIADAYNDAAEKACFPSSKNNKDDENNENGKDENNVICGYLKIGNLLEILERLASQVCKDDGS